MDIVLLLYSYSSRSIFFRIGNSTDNPKNILFSKFRFSTILKKLCIILLSLDIIKLPLKNCIINMIVVFNLD